MSADSKARRLGHCLDAGRQTALMTSSSVLVKDALGAHGVDHALSLLEGFTGTGLVAGNDELAHALDGGAILAALSRKVLIASNGLTGALAGLVGIGHLVFLKIDAWTQMHAQKVVLCA